MTEIEGDKLILTGPKGKIHLQGDDEILRKLSMLFEGECEGQGVIAASAKFGYSRQRYYQLLKKFRKEGTFALKSKKTGPGSNYRRTGEVVRQIIRHRFLDSDASAKVIAQKFNQAGYQVSIRSIERVISEYGLQKKTLSLSSKQKTTKRN